MGDDWFTKMLSTRSSPECPQSLQGIWWMQDNSAAEGLLTFHDAIWESESQFTKHPARNWTVDANNCWGISLTAQFNIPPGMPHRFQISPDGKWINIALVSTTPSSQDSHWIYVIQEGDTFTRPDGTQIEITPGQDMMRLSYVGGSIFYQYLVRRVAYLNSDGALVKTKAYEELLAEAQKTDADLLCGYCGCPRFCVASKNNITDQQAITYAEPPSQQAMGDAKA